MTIKWTKFPTDVVLKGGDGGSENFEAVEKASRLSAREMRLYHDMSEIRRATDDIKKLKDINRMAREALARYAEAKVE